jgi:hypothetical protein
MSKIVMSNRDLMNSGTFLISGINHMFIIKYYVMYDFNK